MNVLLTPEFETQGRLEEVDLAGAVKQVKAILEHETMAGLASNKSISRLPETSQEMYVLRLCGLRVSFIIHGADVVLSGIKRHYPQLDVTAGRLIDFTVNRIPKSGVIVAVERTIGPWASVIVETHDPIPQNSQLSIPDLPGASVLGLCLSYSTKQNGTVHVRLSIRYSDIDLRTIQP